MRYNTTGVMAQICEEIDTHHRFLRQCEIVDGWKHEKRKELALLKSQLVVGKTDYVLEGKIKALEFLVSLW